MATSTRLSLEEYFRAHYEGECEFVNGELRPKPMGTGPHARVRARLRDELRRFEQAGHGEALPEMSLRLPNGDVLIPDVLFSAKDQAFDAHGIFDTPPALCIEILSPSQSFAELHDKCRSYLRWGGSLLLGNRSGKKSGLADRPGRSGARNLRKRHAAIRHNLDQPLTTFSLDPARKSRHEVASTCAS